MLTSLVRGMSEALSPIATRRADDQSRSIWMTALKSLSAWSAPNSA